MARLDVGSGDGANAAGVELTNRGTDRAGLVWQCAGVVFKGVRQCAALRAGQ